LFFIEAPIVQFDTKSVRTAGGQMTCFVLIWTFTMYNETQCNKVNLSLVWRIWLEAEFC